MSIKKQFIKSTNREGILYSITDNFIFSMKKHFYLLLYGHVVRRKKILNYLQNTSSLKKLHLGGGNIRLKGFLNSDIFSRLPIDITKKLPFPDNSLNLIFSNHLIEHLYKKQFTAFLAESARVLTTGGQMIIGTPSLEKVAKALFCDNDNSARNLMLNYHKKFSLDGIVTPASYINDLVHLCFGHQYIYDKELITRLALAAGYADIQSIDISQVTDSAIYGSLPKPRSFRDAQSEIFILTR